MRKIDKAEAADASSGEEDGLPVLPSLTALVELLALYGFIYLVDYLVPSIAVLELQPHPFWVPVVLMSLQYGTVSGLLAAGLAIAGALHAGLPEQDFGENHFAFFLRVWGQPLMWLGAALVIGQFRMRQIAAKQELDRLNRALRRQRDDLAEHATGLRKRCENLERALASASATPPHVGLAEIGMLRREAERLEQPDGAGRQRDHDAAAGLPAAFARAVQAAFPDAEASLWKLEPTGLSKLTAPAPEKITDAGIARTDSLYRAVVIEKRRVTALDPPGERDLDGRAVLAAPVIDMHGGSVLGMVTLDRACPAALSAAGGMALDVLAAAIAPRLAAMARVATTDANEGSGVARAPELLGVAPSGRPARPERTRSAREAAAGAPDQASGAAGDR
ncbi:MAG: hypothetical protein AB7E80_12075 [Hyphomicrobiaceae bacterium]